MSVLCKKEDDLTFLAIDRPDVHNALDFPTLEMLFKALQEVEKGVVILSGAGEKAFISGADIHEMDAMSEEQWKKFCQLGHAVGNLLENGPFVSIAAVNGFAFGGGVEMALFCDLIVASDEAAFGMPETSLGVIPSFGGILRLAQAIGKYRANTFMMAGKRLTAKEAFAMGLISQVSPHAEVMQAATELARKVLENGFEAVLGVKRVMHDSEREERESLRCFQLDEKINRMDQFLKRKKHA